MTPSATGAVRPRKARAVSEILRCRRQTNHRRFPRVVLLWKMALDDSGTVGEFFEQPLRHPVDVRRNGRRDLCKRVVVKTNDEAEEWGRSLIKALNAKARRPKVFVSCTLELVDGRPAQRPPIDPIDGRRAAEFSQ